MPVNWDAMVLGPCEAVFGEPAVFLPATGGSYPITGVYDSAYKDVSLIDTGMEANAVQPVIGVRASLFGVLPVQGDMVYVPSALTTYLVRDVRPDGHGWLKLLLADTAEPVTYMPGAGSPYAVHGVFSTNLPTDPGIASGIPTILFPASTLQTSPVIGDQVRVPRASHTYYVTAVLSESNGMTLLQLSA